MGAHDQEGIEMAEIVVSENITLDGVVEDPSGDEGFRRGGWVGRITDRPAVGRAVLDEALGATALLYGRRSYEFFAARWPSRSGGLADRLNGMPKYVVSSTLEEPAWNNSTVLGGDVVEEVSTLKRELEGQLLVAGSIRLVRTLLAHDLVDELRLMVYPVVLGAGERLFAETGEAKPMRLLGSRAGDDVTFLTYAPVRKA
jgi:dihydrofolate reductase